MKHFNAVCYERFPGIRTIAEEPTAWPGVSRPTYLVDWDLVSNGIWVGCTTFEYMSHEPIHRRYHQGEATFSLVYAFQEHFVLGLKPRRSRARERFVTEQNAGRSLAKVRQPPYVLRLDVRAPRQEAVCFMGCEIGQWQEWNHDQSIDWHLLHSSPHDGLRLGWSSISISYTRTSLPFPRTMIVMLDLSG